MTSRSVRRSAPQKIRVTPSELRIGYGGAWSVVHRKTESSLVLSSLLIEYYIEDVLSLRVGSK